MIESQRTSEPLIMTIKKKIDPLKLISFNFYVACAFDTDHMNTYGKLDIPSIKFELICFWQFGRYAINAAAHAQFTSNIFSLKYVNTIHGLIVASCHTNIWYLFRHFYSGVFVFVQEMITHTHIFVCQKI